MITKRRRLKFDDIGEDEARRLLQFKSKFKNVFVRSAPIRGILQPDGRVRADGPYTTLVIALLLEVSSPKISISKRAICSLNQRLVILVILVANSESGMR